MIDEETRKFTINEQGLDIPLPTLRAAIENFTINNLTTGDAMQIGAVGEKEDGEEENYGEGIYALGRNQCAKCGGIGHFAEDCPQQIRGRLWQERRWKGIRRSPKRRRTRPRAKGRMLDLQRRPLRQ